ncbi:MAG TPA: hypothetical protein PKC80_05060 [Burkholderiaceae bacterium]|nr:hypothetical protein [Burkholderiaceae bacterium]
MVNPSTNDSHSSTWLGALMVLLVAVFYAFGLPAINARIPGTVPEPAGVTIAIGNGFSVVSPAGWMADLVKTKPNETMALNREASSLVATSFDWTGSEEELFERSRSLLVGLGHFDVRSKPSVMQTAQGLKGHTYTYMNDKFDGRIWLFTIPGSKSAAAVRVRSLHGHGQTSLRDAKAVVDSLKFQEPK